MTKKRNMYLCACVCCGMCAMCVLYMCVGSVSVYMCVWRMGVAWDTGFIKDSACYLILMFLS